MTQQAGQYTCAFLEQLKCAASEADIEGMSLEDALCLTLLSGVCDIRLKEKLSELDPPTLPAFGVLIDAQLQGPPIAQDFGMGLQDYQGTGYPVPQIDFRGREAEQYSRRPVSHTSSSFDELSDEPEPTPVVQRQRPRRSQTPVPVSASRSSSRTRFSNVPSGSESEGGGRRNCPPVNKKDPD